MLFEKEKNGSWNNEAISFANDLIFETEDKRFDNKAYAKLLSFLNENRDSRELLLKYTKQKYDSWMRLNDELKRERKKNDC